jgi:hypothetical protein
VKLDIDLTEQTTADNLPDHAKDQMFLHLDDVAATDIHHRASNRFRGVDDNIVVLRHLERIQSLDLLPRSIEDSLIDGIRHAVVDELCEDKPVLAFVEHLESVGGKWKTLANVRITSEDRIDVAGEFRAFFLVDVVDDIRRGALDLDPAADRGFLAMTGDGGGCFAGCSADAASPSGLPRARAQFGDELYGTVSQKGWGKLGGGRQIPHQHSRLTPPFENCQAQLP